MNRFRRHGLLSLCLAMIIALVAGGVAGGTADAAPTRSADVTEYAVARPVCAQPSNPAVVRCLAMRRFTSSRTTPGAARWVRRDGVSYGPAGGYTPNDLATAYGYSPTINRSSQTVAVIDWHDNPYALADLNAFDYHYGYHAETATSFRKVNQSGRTTALPARDPAAATEISLDVQAVRAVCRTCKILLVEAQEGTLPDLAAAVNTAARLGATEISNSYGMPEPAHLTSAVARAYDHPGIPITVSSGDDGWYGWDWLNSGDTSDNAASFPSTATTVVAVGGTTLRLGSGGTRSTEYAWNGNGADDSVGSVHGPRGASGGGCSHLFSAPPWQSATAGYAAAGCRGKRLATDVSAIADPLYGFDVYDRYGMGGWGTIGGTSLAAPVVAAMYALAGGSGGTSYPASSLYTNHSYRPSTFYDVTLGGTGFCAGDDSSSCQDAARALSGGTADNPNGIGGGLAECSYPHTGRNSALPHLSSECNATPGFDGASGVGVPSTLSALHTTTAGMAVSHPSSVKHRHAATLALTANQRVPGTTITSVSWNFGDGSKPSTGHSVRLNHTWAKAGSYLITVTTYDNRHQYATVQTVVRVT